MNRLLVNLDTLCQKNRRIYFRGQILGDLVLSQIMKRMIFLKMLRGSVIRLSRHIKSYRDFLKNLSKRKRDPYFKRKMITSSFCHHFPNKVRPLVDKTAEARI